MGVSVFFSLRKKLFLTVFVALLTVLLHQKAHAIARLFSFDAGMSSTRLGLSVRTEEGNDVDAAEADLSQKFSGNGWGVGIGFDLWRWISLKTDFVYLGKSEVSSSNPTRESGSIIYQGVTNYLVGSYPVRDYGLQYHGKIGFFHMSAETELDYVRQNNASGVSMGGSITYYTRDGWGGHFDMSLHSENLQVFTLGASRRLDFTTKETRLSPEQKIDLEVENLQRILNYTKEAYSELLTANSQSDSPIIRFNTPPFDQRRIDGLTEDDDGDGVPNSLDKCPGTPLGADVDQSGCPISTEQVKTNILSNNTRLYPDVTQLDDDDDILEDIGRSILLDRLDLLTPVSASEFRALQEAGVGRRLEGLDVEDLLGINPVSNEDTNAIENELSSAEEILSRTAAGKFADLSKVLFSNTKDILSASFNAVSQRSNQQSFASLSQEEKDAQSVLASIANSDAGASANTASNAQVATGLDSLISEISNNVNQQQAVSEEALIENQQFSDNEFSILNRPIIFQGGDSELNYNNQLQLSRVAEILRNNRNISLSLNTWKSPDSTVVVPSDRLKKTRDYLLENGVNGSQLSISNESDITNNTQFANQVEISWSN